MLNINFKKILSVVFMAVVCSGVGFSSSGSVIDTSNTATTSTSSGEIINTDTTEKSNKKIKGYTVTIAEASQYIRAAFWVFTLILSLTGVFIVVRRRDKQEDKIEL